jgi:DNA invertase Pin-like site-specific DNA recombinase
MAHGHDIEAVQWFEDVESGATLERPAFQKLEASIFAGEVKTVVVWKLDRLARRLQDGINILSAWCSTGVRVVSVTQQIDLSGSVGQLIASVLFGIAAIERDYIRERQRIGIEAAKKRGVYQGGKKGTRKAKPERVKTLKEKGLRADEIAAALNISRRSVFNYLKE